MDTSSISNNLTAFIGIPANVALPQVTPDQRALIQSVKAAVKTVNDSQSFGDSNELTFFVDRNSRQAVVRIVNRDTGEVVEQIPNEQVLRMAEAYRGQ